MIANKTTTVAASRTVAEIQQMLANVGASSILMDYEGGEPVAVAFKLNCKGTDISFRLPCNWEGVLAALKREKGMPRTMLNHQHAKRVGWRIIKDWLRAQLSLIEAGATTMQEVMLPWALTANGSTVAQAMLSGATARLGLPAPNDD